MVELFLHLKVQWGQYSSFFELLDGQELRRETLTPLRDLAKRDVVVKARIEGNFRQCKLIELVQVLLSSRYRGTTA